jgi:PST family polysaccharide transporter
MLASSLASSAVLLAVRTRISRTQGLEVTGQFDAAWGISMNHATLVLASLQTYYLPALARARCAQERARYVAGVFKVATLVALPAIVAIAVLKPWVLTVLYSHAFRPAASYLRWTLIGDYLKIGCSVLSLPLVATADMRAFLVAEATALAAFIASASLISMVQTAAEGAAIGYVVCYAVHFAVCYGYARRRHEFRPGRKEAAIWAAGLAAVVGLSAIP